jgi:hypothetical protein
MKRRHNLRIVVALLAALEASAGIAHGSYISVFASGTGLKGINKVDNPSNGQDLLYDEKVGAIFPDGLYAQTEAFADPSPGILRVGLAAFTGNPDPARFASESVNGQIAIAAQDRIFLTGAPASGSLSLRVKLEGSTRLDALNSAGAGQPKTADAEWSLAYNIGNVRMLTISDSADLSKGFDEVATQSNISRIDTLLIPYVGSSFDLNQSLLLFYSCFAGRLETCDSTGFFENTFQLGGALILDDQGNVVSGAGITSQTGYDYTQALSLTATATPEPALWVPLSLTLGFMAFKRRHSPIV